MTPLPTILEVLDRHGATSGDRRAYTFLPDGERVGAEIDYGDLPGRARAVAARLQEVARAGDRALLLYPPGPGFLVGFLGCLFAGLVAVPVFPPNGERQRRRLVAVAQDAGARLLLTTADLAGPLQGRRRVPGLDDVAIVRTDEAVAADAARWREVEAGPGTLALLQYTSGSTGAPKGVMLTHGNLAHNCAALTAASAHDGRVVVSWLPQSHDMGLIASLLLALFAGVHAVVMPPEAFLREPVRWLRAITRYGGTFSGAPNFAYDLCVRRTDPGSREGLDLSSWQVAFNAAEPIRAATLERFTGTFGPYGFRPGTLYPGYGLAEFTVCATASRPGEPPHVQWLDARALGAGQVREVPAGTGGARPVVRCGWVAPDVGLRIVDPETRATCPPGAVGEIWLRGGSVGAGYWREEGATLETFRARLSDAPAAGEWLRTGDLGYTDTSGALYVTGRRKDVLILRGQNHYPQDLELTAEEAHPLLRPGCGAAFTVEADGEDRLVLVSEVRSEALADEETAAVVTAVSGALLEGHGLAPLAITLVRKGTVLKTTSGKIARRANRDAFLEGTLDVVASWVSTTAADPTAVPAVGGGTVPAAVAAGSEPAAADLRRALVEAMGARLGVPPGRVDPRATFAENGMDSTGLVELAEVASRHCGRHVGPPHFFEHPTPERAARALVAAAPQHDGVRRDGVQQRGVQQRGVQQRGVQQRGVQQRGVPQGAVAVVGAGCRFPSASHPRALWDLLREGRDCIGPAPPERAELGLHAGVGGFLEDVSGFDAGCFGIAPREAAWTDPQQRLLLEVTWDALEDAHQRPSRLAGGRVGVFVGISNSDYGRLMAAHPADAYAGTGTALSMAANRVSYTFDFQGPSVAVDTACSASLVAVHQAVVSLRSGESDLAVAGGVNLVLSPYVTSVFTRANMLSPSGRCRTFDDRADGYVRGEGCGVVVLKRLEDALADGDPIRAVIRGSAVNQDGRSNGLTAPSGRAQRRVVADALRDAGLDADDVAYVETHGTGTRLGDPVEFDALSATFPRRSGGRPTYIGSVKTNLGHTEAAAGIAGLLKAVLAVQHGWLPPHLHLERPNRHLDLASSGLEVVTEGRPWPEGAARVAGVSSFGFGGANAHVVVEGPPPAAGATAGSSAPQLLTISAHSRPALVEAARRYAEHLASTGDDLADVCAAARTGRDAREHRLAVTGETPGDVRARLDAFVRDGSAAGVVSAGASPPAAPRVGFVFPGQGAEFAGMAAGLAAWSPRYRRELDTCLEGLDAGRRGPVEAALLGTGDAEALLRRTAVAQPALFAAEYALARLWQSWGVHPTCVAGHSLGEYVAAAVAGVLDPGDAMRLVAVRGELVEAAGATGAMAALALRPSEVDDLLGPHATRVSVAAINGPRQVVVSGEAGAVHAVVEEATRRRVTAKLQPGHYAFHSHLVEPAVEHFRDALAAVALRPPAIDLVAGVTGRLASGDVATPGYWAAQLRQPVRFADGVETLLERGCGFVVEVGPSPVLLLLLRRAAAGRTVECLPSLRPDEGAPGTMLHTLGRLWAGGAVDDLAEADLPGPGREHARRVVLPAYPFQRRRHWLPATRPGTAEAPRPGAVEASVAAPVEAAVPAPRPGHPLLGQPATNGDGVDGEDVWTRRLRPGDVPLVADHRIEGRVVVPGVAYLEMAVAAARERAGPARWHLEDVEYRAVLALGDGEGRDVRVRLARGAGPRDFAVESRPPGQVGAAWTLHARGRVGTGDAHVREEA